MPTLKAETGEQRLAHVGRMPPLERLLYFVRERQTVYECKQAGQPRPWTVDPILRSYYFCNVYREQDKVTSWLRENVRDPLQDDPRVLFAVIAFRWFNYIPTGELLWNYGKDQEGTCDLLTQWNLPLAKQVLKMQQERVGQVFTGAFNISNSGSTKPKIDRVCDDYIQPVWEDKERIVSEIKLYGTLADAHVQLRMYPGLGGSGFMAAQVVADLKYTYLLRDAPDFWTWCCLGPGSKRGLNRLNGAPPNAPTPKSAYTELEDLRAVINREFSGKLPRMHAQDVQNCLCEFSKYETARLGDGHLKRRYAGV